MTAPADEPKVEERAGEEDGEDGEEGGAPDMAGLEAMMGGMGGKDDGEGGAGGMDMSALMAMLGKGGGKGGMPDMGGMGGGKGGGQGEVDDAEKAGEGGKFHWQQKGEEIQIRVPLDPPATKKDISVKFKVSSLSVAVRGESIIDGALAGKVEVDECTWCLSSDKSELQVMLTQVAGKSDTWPALLEA